MQPHVPTFNGAFVKRITRDPGGFTLWFRRGTSSALRPLTLVEARRLRDQLADGSARNELTDALHLCAGGHQLSDS